MQVHQYHPWLQTIDLALELPIPHPCRLALQSSGIRTSLTTKSSGATKLSWASSRKRGRCRELLLSSLGRQKWRKTIGLRVRSLSKLFFKDFDTSFSPLPEDHDPCACVNRSWGMPELLLWLNQLFHTAAFPRENALEAGDQFSSGPAAGRPLPPPPKPKREMKPKTIEQKLASATWARAVYPQKKDLILYCR